MKISDFKPGVVKSFFLVAGSVVESRERALITAKMICAISGKLGLNAIINRPFIQPIEQREPH